MTAATEMRNPPGASSPDGQIEAAYTAAAAEKIAPAIPADSPARLPYAASPAARRRAALEVLVARIRRRT
jgi:hypothetical protein